MSNLHDIIEPIPPEAQIVLDYLRAYYSSATYQFYYDAPRIHYTMRDGSPSSIDPLDPYWQTITHGREREGRPVTEHGR